MNVHHAVPIFNVRDLSASSAYYQEVLGFELNWEYEGIVCSVKRVDCELMLVQQDQGKGQAWIYVGVGDVELLYQELIAKGAMVRQGPTNFSWAMELQIADPDGNVIRFGSGPKEDVEFGPWLGMHE